MTHHFLGVHPGDSVYAREKGTTPGRPARASPSARNPSSLSGRIYSLVPWSCERVEICPLWQPR